MRMAFALAAASTLALAAPAMAQEATDDIGTFSGFYVAAAAGMDFQGSDAGEGVTFDRNLDGTFGDTVTTAAGANAFTPGFCNGAALTNAPAGGCRKDRDALGYSARVGADRQFGSLVFGVVGEFGKSNIRDSVSAYSTTPASYTLTREVDWVAAARARAGVAVNHTLFYGTGGAAYSRIDSSFATTNAQNAFGERGSETQWGFQYGGGVEQKVARNFSIGVEYLFTQFNNDDYRVRATQGSAAATNPFVLAPNTAGTDFARTDDKFRWHQVRAVAAFRF